MHQMTSEWPSINRQKYPVYTEYAPRGPIFTPFRSTTSRFRDTMLLKVENAPMTPEWP